MSDQMRALVYDRYGPPSGMEEKRIDRPVPAPKQILVRVRATSINPYDLHLLRGDPYVARTMGMGMFGPKKPRVPGSDIAGVVEAVGSAVDESADLAPGDEVFGTAGMGGLADYVTLPATAVAGKPANLTFEQAAAVPMAGITALMAVRDFGEIEEGQSVIVNGASGGVGSFAVQLARALGAAEVVGVCSARNAELVRSIGATDTIDYEKDDFTKAGRKFDVLVDTVGNHGARAFARAVKPKGKLVVVGGGGGRWLGPIGQFVGAKLSSPFLSARVRLVLARVTTTDLDFLAELIEDGKVRPVVDQVFPFSEARDALAYLETRHARGKVVISVD